MKQIHGAEDGVALAPFKLNGTYLALLEGGIDEVYHINCEERLGHKTR